MLISHSNPPNPPLIKGGKGEFSTFAGYLPAREKNFDLVVILNIGKKNVKKIT